MTNPEVRSRYRNLLIALAREHEGLIRAVKSIRAKAAIEQSKPHQCGLYHKANTINGRATKLRTILLKNTVAMQEFFGTEELQDVEKQSIHY